MSCNAQLIVQEPKSFTCDTIKDPFRLANTIFERGDNIMNYNAYNELLAYEQCFSGVSEKDLYYQSVLTYSALANDNNILKVVEEKREKIRGNNFPSIFDTGNFDEALLNESLKTSNVVIINESHHHPEHRVLLSKWLQKFADLGFEYLAVEALFNDSITKRNYPLQTDGFYTKEPHFANLLREAKRKNFKLISYDDYAQKNRDSVAAVNLYNKTLALNPKAKVVVYVGYEHLNEDTNLQKPWLAAYLKILYDIDPLTISQTNFYQYYIQDYQKVKDNNAYSIISNLQNRVISDFKLFNQIELEKSYNCFDHTLQKQFTYKLKALQENDDCLILIFNKNEFEKEGKNAVPILIKSFKSKDKKINLNICKGEYVVVYQGKSGRGLKKDSIIIK